MRHAKAEPHAGSDRERRLTERGRADAAEAGRWLAAQGFAPDHALVSSAERARETWEALSSAAGWSVRPSLESALYTAAPETVLDMVRQLPEAERSVLVIGHNPTIAYLAQLLDDGGGDPDVATEMAAGHPTSSLTVFEYDGAWGGLDHGTARAVAFHVGRA